jgi:class 3 adenylate cyclase
VRQLVVTVGLRERVFEIASSLLPPHVISKLDERASARSESCARSVDSIFSLSEKHDSVIILHADVVGFTAKCARVGVGEVFESVSRLFNAVDDLCREFELTKIETIGDAYWCSHGLTRRATPADARRMLRFAAALRKVAGSITIGGDRLKVRIGIHVGPMLGGIVGNRFPRYHLFGPHAKVGQVLEQTGIAEASVVSNTFRRLLMQTEEEDASKLCKGSSSLQRNGSGSLSPAGPREFGARELVSGSWNVISWRSVLQQSKSTLSVEDDELLNEVGPVTLDSPRTTDSAHERVSGRRQANHGVVLRRHEHMDLSVLNNLDSNVTEMVLPAWLAFDIEHQIPGESRGWEGGGAERLLFEAPCNDAATAAEANAERQRPRTWEVDSGDTQQGPPTEQTHPGDTQQEPPEGSRKVPGVGEDTGQ